MTLHDTPPSPSRRQWLAAAASLALPGRALADEAMAQALRSGGAGAAPGAVLMFRHALAPGTFDPPNFALGDCATQRNLNEEGRQQARQIGAWFASRQLKPTRVRSSPWCRCMETAELAFGDATGSEGLAWPALGSPHGRPQEARAQALRQLQAALEAVVQRRAGFEVWVSHDFVFNAWLGESVRAGEGLWLGLKADGAVQVLGRLDARVL